MQQQGAVQIFQQRLHHVLLHILRQFGFLSDYLNGDTYFKIHREHHNLNRARNQFKLVADLENMEEELLKY